MFTQDEIYEMTQKSEELSDEEGGTAGDLEVDLQEGITGKSIPKYNYPPLRWNNEYISPVVKAKDFSINQESLENKDKPVVRSLDNYNAQVNNRLNNSRFSSLF